MGRERDIQKVKAKRIFGGELVHPWRKYGDGIPNWRTLRRWRECARELSKLYGGAQACAYCKRPLGKNCRKVKLWTHARSTRPTTRYACDGCFGVIFALLAQMEYLPPFNEGQLEEE